MNNQKLQQARERERNSESKESCVTATDIIKKNIIIKFTIRDLPQYDYTNIVRSASKQSISQ